MFCMELGLIGNSQAEVEHYARGGGLFDEDSHPRDAGGLFAPKNKSGGATIDDAPFSLGQAKADKGKGGHEKQASLFDTDLHGAEARDLPGQTNFLGGEPEDTPATSGIDKSDSPRANESDQERNEREFTENYNDVSADPPKAKSRNLHRAMGWGRTEIRHQGRRLERGEITKQAHDDLTRSLQSEIDWYGQILKERGDYAGGGPYSDEPKGKRR